MKERTQFNYAQRWRLEQNLTKQATRKRKIGILTVVLAGLFVLAILASPWLWQYKLRFDLSTTEKEIGNYQEVAAALQQLDVMQAEVAAMEGFLHTVENSSKDPRDVNAQIRSLLPAGATITSFSLQADYSVQVGLLLPGALDVAQLWMNFRDSGLFEDFDIDDVSLDDGTKNLTLTIKMKQ